MDHHAAQTGVAQRLPNKVLQGHFTHTNSTLLIGKVVGGIDYYLIGIALLIFGYGIYELVISDIDPRQQEPS